MYLGRIRVGVHIRFENPESLHDSPCIEAPWLAISPSPELLLGCTVHLRNEYMSRDIAKRFANLNGQVVPVGDAGSGVSSQEIVAVAGENVVNLRVESYGCDKKINTIYNLPFFRLVFK